MKIVALDGAIAAGGDLTWEKFERMGEFVYYDTTSPDQLLEHAADADALIINKVKISAENLAKLPKLKYIGVIATGYDNIDVEAAKQHGVTVTNVPNYSSDSVAQQTIALLLELTNHVAEYDKRVQKGEWITIPYLQAVSENSLRIMELAGKTMAIYGLGHIGMKVAQIANAFGMKVISPTSKKASQLPDWIEKITSVHEMFGRADILSLNAPLTPDSRHIVNSETLALMKPTALIVNTSRGGLIDQTALNEALEKGTIAGAAIDVTEVEPPATDLPLISNPKCIITPHVAWDSLEARQRLMDLCASNLENYLEGKPQNVVN